VRFAVRLLRHRGRVLPWRLIVNRPPLIGDLRIEEVRDEELRRYLRTAMLWDDMSVRPSADPPCLFDVHIVGMSPQAFSLTGFERVDGAEYMQSWLVRMQHAIHLARSHRAICGVAFAWAHRGIALPNLRIRSGAYSITGIERSRCVEFGALFANPLATDFLDESGHFFPIVI
jgi:hypothetical protein